MNTEATKPGRIIVVSAPSGAGKDSILGPAMAEDDALAVAVSATTRAPRPGEADGVAYYFLSVDEFIRRREAGGFAEWAEVHGNLYGTLRTELDRLLATGKDVVLELDVQGMRNIRASGLNPLTIFIMPPSLPELERRLRRRGTDSDEAIALRLANAQREMAASGEFDRIIVNDDLAAAVAEFKAIVAMDRAARG